MLDKDSFSTCQLAAAEKIEKLLMTNRSELIISGTAGSGKTYLIKAIKHIVGQCNALHEAVGAVKKRTNAIYYTGTNNAAVEVLRSNGIHSASTIHSLLGLTVMGKELVRLRNVKKFEGNALIILDECSFVDRTLINFLDEARENSSNLKIIYFGDKAQLPPIHSSDKTIFEIGIDQLDMTTVRRQDDNTPLYELCTYLRHAVLSGDHIVDVRDWYGEPDVQHVDRSTFVDMAIEAYKNKENVKVVTWTNPASLSLNEYIHEAVKGSGNTHFQVGDYIIANTFMKHRGMTIANGTRIMVEAMGKPYQCMDNPAIWYADVMTHLPKDVSNLPRELRVAVANNHLLDTESDFADICDFRLDYSCTIHKSQGQTFDTVFVDLDSLRGCHDDDIFRRLLYVAVSRARHKVVFTGKL